MDSSTDLSNETFPGGHLTVLQCTISLAMPCMVLVFLIHELNEAVLSEGSRGAQIDTYT